MAGQPVQRLHSFCQAKDENLMQVKAARKKWRRKRSGRFYSAADVQVVEEMLEVWKRPTVADIKAVFFFCNHLVDNKSKVLYELSEGIAKKNKEINHRLKLMHLVLHLNLNHL